jgi:hypothetical protein
MFKLARTSRTAHTRQKPKPRLVTKAHRLERDEQLSEVAAAPRPTGQRKGRNPSKD